MPALEEFPVPDIHLVELLPGMAAGAVQVALGHPFDTIKTRSQVHADLAGADGARISSRRAARELINEGGVRALYRGALPPILVNGSKRGLQLALWEYVTPLVGGNSFLSGAVAGVAGTLVSCPLHVVKIRAQTSQTTSTSIAAARHIFANEGPRAFYRGLPQHAVRDIGFAGAYLGTYGSLRDSLPAGLPMRPAVAAVVASTVTWVCLQPLDTVKTMSQAGVAPSELLRRIVTGTGEVDEGSRSTARSVARRAWRGLGAALMRAGPVNATGMMVYEAAKKRVVDWEVAHGVEPYRFGGGAPKAAAAAS
uniref:Mitochondrial carrier protein n=1 Tax=Neobodo designis TaxID=312471 RepID=A0A7S1PX77_NEODS|mmetsp:Transcript_222/g.869  ORF Transcript_222/g.869 Transcript_222/m.869 type:complete len:309 (+) Transcript_222:136-1062(+)|eukprot:CAMPEP_0174868208 /NCGR_PEP_ID=MMETSP1114-20130205/65504_1 /TAXON_ID=312471 /ORGANISM="Neobodo designis, Strain CCAP 1951/1" /LENGTH=308 /DNA_ID=CAMNT_0016103425 /DNA_START=136 /DNA_END=1062 /DNA_ORIENTATION=-